MQRGTKRSETGAPEERKRFRLRLAYVILAIAMALFAYKFLEKTKEIRGLAQQAAALRYQNQQTARQNASLQRSIKNYRTPQYVENEARAVFGYTLPGDVAIESQPIPRPVVTARAAPPRPAPPPLPIWEQWWKVFF